MAKQLLDSVFSHWNKPSEGFQTSAMDFYASVEAALQRRQIPDVSVYRVDLHEGRTLSAMREYLRFTRQKLAFDLCAAPYGTGYFYSWLGERPPSRLLCWAVGLGVLIPYSTVSGVVFLRGSQRSAPRLHNPDALRRLLISVVALVPVFFACRSMPRRLGHGPGRSHPCDPILGGHPSPVLPPRDLLQGRHDPHVPGAGERSRRGGLRWVATADGLRTLTEDERKPIMRDPVRRESPTQLERYTQ